MFNHPSSKVHPAICLISAIYILYFNILLTYHTKGNPEYNCGFMILNLGGWRQYTCTIPAVLTCACQHPQQMYLKLRGLCPQSNIDRFYVPRNQRGAVQFIGLMNSIMEFDKNTLSWKLTDHLKDTRAVSKASLASYVLGSQNWTIENDNVECSFEGEAYNKMLKLTGCQEQEFTCNDGECIRGCHVS